jgi:hypothetical protein
VRVLALQFCEDSADILLCDPIVAVLNVVACLVHHLKFFSSCHQRFRFIGRPRPQCGGEQFVQTHSSALLGFMPCQFRDFLQ